MFATRFVMLAAGLYHSAALASDGAVWTWGDGGYGCLGHGDEQARSTPTRLGKEAFGGSAAVMVACGYHHTMVVTADGRLWTFGCGGSGRLGHGDTEHKLIPTLVLAVKICEAKIVMVANIARPPTKVGSALCSSEVSPSCAWSPVPHAHSPPSSVTAAVCLSPQAIAMIVRGGASRYTCIQPGPLQ